MFPKVAVWGVGGWELVTDSQIHQIRQLDFVTLVRGNICETKIQNTQRILQHTATYYKTLHNTFNILQHTYTIPCLTREWSKTTDVRRHG